MPPSPPLSATPFAQPLALAPKRRCCGSTSRNPPKATTVRSTGTLRGLTVNMRDISDTVPTLAAIAPLADGPVRIEDVYNIRIKECDRLDATAIPTVGTIMALAETDDTEATISA